MAIAPILPPAHQTTQNLDSLNAPQGSPVSPVLANQLKQSTTGSTSTANPIGAQALGLGTGSGLDVVSAAPINLTGATPAPTPTPDLGSAANVGGGLNNIVGLLEQVVQSLQSQVMA